MELVRRTIFVFMATVIGTSTFAVEPIPSQTPDRSPTIVGRTSNPTDGTFGYDVRRPFFFSQSAVDHLFLNPGNREAKGYKTDGPRVFDILSIRPIKKSLHLEKEKHAE